jgi:hypothetical protein
MYAFEIPRDVIESRTDQVNVVGNTRIVMMQAPAIASHFSLLHGDPTLTPRNVKRVANATHAESSGPGYLFL